MYDKSNIESEKFEQSEGILQKIDKVIILILRR